MAAVAEFLPQSFWFEMSFRLRKLVTISAVLERMNLESFSTDTLKVVPKPEDLPQAITTVLLKVIEFENSDAFAKMKQKYIETVLVHKDELLL